MLQVVDELLISWIFAITTSITIVLFVVAVRTWPRGKRCRCVGTKRKWWRHLAFSWALWRGRCWYNLDGLTPNEKGAVRCPECGTVAIQSRLKKDGRCLRLGSVCFLFFAVAIASGYLGPVRNGTWARVFPTYPLVMMASTSLGEHRTDIRDEISRRVTDGNLSGRSASLLSETLVTDLRDDGVQWNRSSATKMLKKLWPSSKDSLEHEAVVGDNQSRSAVMWILQTKMETPSDILLSLCVSNLRDEALDGTWKNVQQDNARSALHYLTDWYLCAGPYLREGMRSSDPQQRFLSAVATGFGGGVDQKELVVEVLAPYLHDNDTMGDAKLAAPAIYRLGPEVIPLLEIKLNTADTQARSIILHIIERLDHPDRPYNKCYYTMPRLTGWQDPLTTSLRSLTHYFWIDIEDSQEGF